MKISPERYRVLCQEAEREIGRTIKEANEQEVKGAAVNSVSTVLSLLDVEMA